MKDFVELKVHDMSTMIYPADAYVLILEEVNGVRKMPIIIGRVEAKAIKVSMSKFIPPRPLTHDLMVELLRYMDMNLKEVLIYRAEDGVFFSRLHFYKAEDEFIMESRTSDAVALALRLGCPIYTTEEIIQSEQLHDLGEGKFSIPITSVSLQMLEEALQAAIEKEEYEQASQLRDEIRKRKEMK